MRKTLTTLAMLFCLASCIAGGTTDDETQSGLLPVGSEAPDFVMYTEDHPEGFTLSSLRGRTVVLEFWASWCPDCRKVTEDMKELYDTYASDDTVFVGFSFDTNEESWRNYVSENGLSWIQYSLLTPWKENEIAAAWDVKWIPTFYVIDTEGKVAAATIEINDLKRALSSDIVITRQKLN